MKFSPLSLWRFVFSNKIQNAKLPWTHELLHTRIPILEQHSSAALSMILHFNNSCTSYIIKQQSRAMCCTSSGLYRLSLSCWWTDAWRDICQYSASTKVGHNITKAYKLSINERLKVIIIWLLANGKCLLQPPSYSKNILLQLYYIEACVKKQLQKGFYTWLRWFLTCVKNTKQNGTHA